MIKSAKAKRRERRMASIANLFSCLPGERQQRVLDAVMDVIAEHQGDRDAADRRAAPNRIDARYARSIARTGRDGRRGGHAVIDMQEGRGVRKRST